MKKVMKDRNVHYHSKLVAIARIKSVLWGVGIGLLIAGLATFIVSSMKQSHVMRETSTYHPATFAVAEKFMCGCPKCELELAECTCNESSGGVYEMYYISEQLKTGLSEKQVIREVHKKFGKIKAQYLNIING